MSESIAIIALGANIPSVAGGPAESLRVALRRLPIGESLRLTAISRFWQSPAFPAGAGPDYVNACALVATTFPPESVLAHLHRIEAGLGRVRDGGRWQSRGIDLDLIAQDGIVCPDRATQTMWRDLAPAMQRERAPDQLILPHPRLAERGFVLAPLAEIAPHWRHPLTGQSVAAMLDALPPEAMTGLVPLPCA